MTKETTCRVRSANVSSKQAQQAENEISVSCAFDITTGNMMGDLESLLEMDVDVYTEQEEHLGFDPCVSLETLALQSPHGSNSVEKTWNEDGDNNGVAATSVDPSPESFSCTQERRRLSLRKELFQHRIKAQDLSSPGPRAGNDTDGMTSLRPSYEDPEYDLASPLALPPSPTSFLEPYDDALGHSSCLNNQDDVRLDPILSKASPASTRLRVPKVKHGGIYSLLLKGLKRPEENDSAVLVESTKDSAAKGHSLVCVGTDTFGEMTALGSDLSTSSMRMSPSPSMMQVRHGGIYRLLREKT
ncbi:hypothetical protein H310_01134 [Aphanomyces invadans]|uniref:Uncharacterized protein n=1 Tax=Aphanomyces invadans TaxID=157072 RepID=A0A024UQY7_9STRA|nr:hypothetical protein H310_01134 [Aphanomyces invadans]ETW08585.1 hypothetical protein H310_01134 [Aphanomyces invadans]|eukprot:XP_008862390.1 hypothetical protein H310_01134 [Aphanomyces invadans]